MKIKSFECPKSIRNYKKNNAWNIRHLVDKSFVTVNKQPAYYIANCRILHTWKKEKEEKSES